MYDLKTSSAEKGYFSNQKSSPSRVGDLFSERHSSINTYETVTYGSDFLTPITTDGFQIEQFSSPGAFDHNQYHTLHAVPLDEPPHLLDCSENSNSVYTQVKGQTSHQQLHPGHSTNSQSQSTNQTYTPSLFLQTLSIPRSYAENEPSFSRRILRKCFQYGGPPFLLPASEPPQPE
jgi:hypothetical protein